MPINNYEIQFHGYPAHYISLPITEETNPFETDFENVGSCVEDALNSEADCNGWHHGVCDDEDFQIRDCGEFDLSEEEIERREACEQPSN